MSLSPADACLNGARVTRTSSQSAPWALAPALAIVTTLRRSVSEVNVKDASCDAMLSLSEMERSSAAVWSYGADEDELMKDITMTG